MDQRSFVDYSLRRRAVLREYAEGKLDRDEVCDAQSYLKQAAHFHGDSTSEACPICVAPDLTLVHYVYGDKWKVGSGQAKTAREVVDMAERMTDFNVYVVEVCRDCGWNYLRESFRTGLEPPPKRTRRRAPAPPTAAVDLNDL